MGFKEKMYTTSTFTQMEYVFPTLPSDPGKSKRFYQAVAAVEAQLIQLRTQAAAELPDQMQPAEQLSSIEALIANTQRITYDEFVLLKEKELLLTVNKGFDTEGTDLDSVTCFIIPLAAKDIAARFPAHSSDPQTTRVYYLDKQGRAYDLIVREAHGETAVRIWMRWIGR